MKEKSTGPMSQNRESKTDWDYLDSVTDEEIEKAIDADPDTVRLEDCDLSKLKVKKPLSRVLPIEERSDR
ncbi:MAG: hypothetical protein HN521_01300 [Candidatus Latescibacteria bacterium]|jgi:hypothetical protein|nr:hypothetical protein [Candidatus Latescibacterota bacterium]